MTRIYTSATIHKPIETVFDYVTTPAHWPEWHPSSLAVSGSTDHSLRMGESVTEDFRVAGRRGRVVWRVQECEPLTRWSIVGQVVGRGSGGAVSYTLTARDGGTFFEREFIYRAQNIVFAVLDTLIFRRRIETESAVAVAALRRVLEAR